MIHRGNSLPSHQNASAVRLGHSFEVVNVRFMWISRMFTFCENLGEFRIRGLQIGLYLRNISNENLGVDRFISSTSRNRF